MWAQTEFPPALTPKRQITGFGISSFSSIVQIKNIILFARNSEGLSYSNLLSSGFVWLLLLPLLALVFSV